MIEYVEDRLGHDRRYSIDSSKLRAMGWAPQTDLESALNITVDWYKNHREWWEPLKSKVANR